MNQPNFNPFDDNFEDDFPEVNSGSDRWQQVNPDSGKIAPLHLVSPSQGKQSEGDKLSDRQLIDALLAEYRQTGRVDYPRVQAIARRAYRRCLILPDRARVLFATLDRAEADMATAIAALRQRLGHILEMALAGDRMTATEALNDDFMGVVRAVDPILAIAREHPEPLEPAVEAGVATCYEDLAKRVNDLRYHLRFLHEHLRTHRLHYQLQRESFVDLRLLSLQDAFDDLQRSSADLAARLREVISRKLPEFD